MLAMMTKPQNPPGRPVRISWARRWPPSWSKTSWKKVEQNRIIRTRPVMLEVERAAPDSTDRFRLRLAAARATAAVAPTAPASVGVAMPVKIEPRTARISSMTGATAMSSSLASRTPRIVRASSGRAGAASGSR